MYFISVIWISFLARKKRDITKYTVLLHESDICVCTGCFNFGVNPAQCITLGAKGMASHRRLTSCKNPIERDGVQQGREQSNGRVQIHPAYKPTKTVESKDYFFLRIPAFRVPLVFKRNESDKKWELFTLPADLVQIKGRETPDFRLWIVHYVELYRGRKGVKEEIDAETAELAEEEYQLAKERDLEARHRAIDEEFPPLDPLAPDTEEELAQIAARTAREGEAMKKAERIIQAAIVHPVAIEAAARRAAEALTAKALSKESGNGGERDSADSSNSEDSSDSEDGEDEE